jgi:hypothetical protein
MIENNDVGNVNAAEVEQDTNTTTDGKVNPGAIRKSTTSSILNALSQASGQEFQSVEAALAYVARTATQKSVAPLQQVDTSDDQSRMGRETTDDNDLREQFQKLRQELTQKERALAQKDLDSEIIRSIGDRFDPDLTDYALQKIKANIKFNRDGSYSIVNQKGQERYAMDGNPLTLKGLIDEVAQGNPKLLKGNTLQSGSGLRPGQSQFAGAQPDAIPDYSKDPAAFNAWASKNGLGKRVGLKGSTVSATSSLNSRTII